MFADKETRDAIVDLYKEICEGSNFYLYGKTWKPFSSGIATRVVGLKFRQDALEAKLERLMKHLGLQEVKPDCSPLIVKTTEGSNA
jgi:hypothetical protein